MGDLPGGMFFHVIPCLIPDGCPTLPPLNTHQFEIDIQSNKSVPSIVIHAIDGPRGGFARRRRVTMISRCCNRSLDRCESSAQAVTACDCPRRSPAPRLSYAVITSNRWPLSSLK